MQGVLLTAALAAIGGIVAGVLLGLAVASRRGDAGRSAAVPPAALRAFAERIGALERPEEVPEALAVGVREVLGARAEVGGTGAVSVRLQDGSTVAATFPAGAGLSREDAAAGLEGLAALAEVGGIAALARAERADAQALAAARARLEEALAQTEDVFGAAHAALRALGEEAGVTSLVVAPARGAPVSVERERASTSGHVIGLELAGGGRCEVGWPAAPGAAAEARTAALVDALARHLDLVAARERAKLRGLRLAAATAVATAVARDAAISLDSLAEAARDAVGGDAALVYAAVGRDLAAVAAHGAARPTTADGAALQAFAARRVALDPGGALLRSGAVEGFEAAVAVPIPGAASPAGAISVLFRDERPIDETSGDDLAILAALAALALERGSADRELGRHRRVRAGLLEVNEMLAASREPDDAYRAIAGAGRRALLADQTLLVSGRGELLAAAGPNATRERPPQLAAVAARDRRPVLCADTASDRRVADDERRRLEALGARSLLCVPVGRGEDGAATAVLVALWSQPRDAGDDELELARHIATAADAAIDRAATIAAERAQRLRAQELQRLGGLIARSLDTPAVLREIVAQAASLLQADACALNLLEGGRVRVSAVQGAVAEGLRGSEVPADGPQPSAIVSRRRRPVAIADLREGSRRDAVDAELLGAGLVSFLGVPVISAAGAVRGVLAVYGTVPRPWRADEIEALEAFAASAAVALENAELFGRAEREKERSESVVASIADGVLVVGSDGVVEAWNPAAEEITGVPSTAVLGRPLRDGLVTQLGGSGEELAGALEHAAATGGTVDARIARSGRESWVTARAAQLLEPGRDEPSTVYALRDVTEDRQLDQLKSDFVATVSHELRTPLTSIYGFAETLMRGDVQFGADDRRTFVQFIATEAQRLTRLVDGLLSVTRLEAGALGLDVDDVDVVALLRDIVETEARRALPSHHVELDAPDEVLLVAADRDKLRQVVLNLIDNAIKYSPGGGAVRVSVALGPNGVELRVADEGIGISATDQRNLFRKFFRADARMTRGIRGIGLGLYLTRGFVSAMGGRIRVESEEGVGSTFIVELPARAADRRTAETGVA